MKLFIFLFILMFCFSAYSNISEPTTDQQLAFFNWLFGINFFKKMIGQKIFS